MSKVVKISYLQSGTFQVVFDDGFQVERNLTKAYNKGKAAQLITDSIDSLFIETFGGLAWPGGYDICPDTLRNHWM